ECRHGGKNDVENQGSCTLVNSSDTQSHRVTATEAQRSEPALQSAVFQRVKQRGEHARAARPDRMAERDGAAVHVDPIPVPLQSLTVGYRLRRERLVRLDQIEVADRCV